MRKTGWQKFNGLPITRGLRIAPLSAFPRFGLRRLPGFCLWYASQPSGRKNQRRHVLRRKPGLRIRQNLPLALPLYCRMLEAAPFVKVGKRMAQPARPQRSGGRALRLPTRQARR
jgi:hypothetical protein